jgi:hypothetical protein
MHGPHHAQSTGSRHAFHLRASYAPPINAAFALFPEIPVCGAPEEFGRTIIVVCGGG